MVASDRTRCWMSWAEMIGCMAPAVKLRLKPPSEEASGMSGRLANPRLVERLRAQG
jgi:hypothetical protein